MKNTLKVVDGKKNIVDVRRKQLGEKAVTLGEQWAHFQIGPKGERRLINAFRKLMPGIAESIVRIVAPSMLIELGQRALNQEIDQEGINFLAHILESKQERSKSAVGDLSREELAQIKKELELISEDWTFSPDPDGHYIDIIGKPQLPTDVVYPEESGMEPGYDEVNIATVYLEEPRNELLLNAQFICQAPGRMRRMLKLLDKGEKS